MWSPDIEQFDLDRYLREPRKGKKMATLRKGTVIFSEGDENNSVFFVFDGAIKFTKHSQNGKEAILGVVDGGSFFGAACVVNGFPQRSYRAVALSDVHLAIIERPAMIRLLQTSEGTLYCFLAYLLSSVSELQESLASNLLYPAGQRLARTLVSLAQLKADSPVKRSFPELGQEDLAQMIGATRQHVNSYLMKFRSLGHIEYKRGLKSFQVNKSMAKVVGSKAK
jgi:CRP/FNR family cyclic AMP-dependent transcriptional regulator